MVGSSATRREDIGAPVYDLGVPIVSEPGAGEAKDPAGATRARLFALLAGLLLTLGATLGFLTSTSFETGSELPSGEWLGVFEVNGWHNALALAAGLSGLVAASLGAARTWALAAGVFYLSLGIWGLLSGGVLANTIAVNDAASILHLAIGGLGLAAALGGHRRAIRRPAAG